MSKTVDLRIDGDLREAGLRVILEIKENHRAILQTEGRLPANPELADRLEDHWLEKYRKIPEVCASRALQAKGVKIRSRMSVLKRSIQECKESEQVLRDRVNQWLDDPSFSKTANSLRDYLKPDEAIRFIVRPEDNLLYKLPWDCWQLIESRTFAQSAFGGQQFARPAIPPGNRNKEKVKILVILGNRDGLKNLEKEKQLFDNFHPQAEVKFLDEPNSGELKDDLWEQNWDIIFFAGHSETKEDRGVISINPKEKLTLDEESQLWLGLKTAVERGLQLVIFNSCDGWGLARRLDDLHIPMMIVMREMVLDQVAYSFLKYFLREYIREGQDLYVAVRRAREQLRDFKIKLSEFDEEIEFPCGDLLPIVWQNPAFDPVRWNELLPPTAILPHAISPRSHRSRHYNIGTVAIASFIIATLIIWGRWQGKLQPLELKAYDFLMQQRALEKPDDRILVIRITPDDVERLKQPPAETGEGSRTLSDRNLNRLFEKLERLQPAAIGLLIAREGSVSPQYAAFKAALESERTIALCLIKSPELASIDRTVFAPDEVANNRIGFYSFLSDLDKVVRRHLLYRKVRDRFPCKGDRVEEFGFQVAQNYLLQQGYARQDRPEDNFIKIGDVKFEPLKFHRGGYHHPDSDVEGGIQVMLNYRPYRDYKTDIVRTVSLSEFFDDQLTLDDVKNRIVLIGRDFSNERELTPYNKNAKNALEKTPGVFIIAQQVSHLLSSVEQKKASIWTWNKWVDALWILSWSLIGGLLVWSVSFLKKRKIKSLLILVFGFGVIFAALYGICFIFLLNGGWIPFVPSALGLFGAGGTILIYHNFKKAMLNP